MSHNQIKIVSNTKKRALAFYMKNELQEWRLISNDSILSRKEYINSSIEDRVEDIVHEINSVYNPGNRGVDIFFEGEEKDFLLLKKTIDSHFSQNNITCVMQKVRTAVKTMVSCNIAMIVGPLSGMKFPELILARKTWPTQKRLLRN